MLTNDESCTRNYAENDERNMEITAIFWIATTVMAVVAVGIVTRPLLMANRKNTLIALAVLVPVLAASLYLYLGSPSTTSHEAGSRASSTTAMRSTATDKKVGSVASMVDGLAQRLQETPEDAGSWLLLARSYKHLNQIPQAIDAYEKAAAMGQFDEELAALANNVTASTDRRAATSSQVAGSVRLSAAAAAIVEPTDTVFIFAKAVGGPPMPVAVLRRAASELPIDFVLDDNLSMTPDIKLSDFSEVVVTARVSRSGDATVALRNLEAHSDSISVAENLRIELIIE